MDYFVPSIGCDATLASIVGGIACYAVFKRYEPHSPPALFLLLILPPYIISSLSSGHPLPFPGTLLKTYATYLGTLISAVVAYRLSPLHPLAKYPGPLLCRLTKINLAAIATGGKQHLWYKKWHDTYGEVVRVGPNELSFTDATAIAPMMGTGGMPKGPWWDGRMGEQSSKSRTLLGLRDPHEHIRRRKRWNKGFSTAALKDYEPIVEKRVTQLVDALYKERERGPGRAVDFAAWISSFAYDFMTDMVFDGGSEMLRDGDVNGLWHLLEAAQPVALVLGHLPYVYEIVNRVPNLGMGLKTFRKYALATVMNRRKMGSLNKDLFYHLMDEAETEASPPTLPEVISDAAPAIIAGADTTSTTITNLFYLLVSHPEVYGRLQEEMDKAEGGFFDTAENAGMVYLNACINETLRLYPPVLSGSQRAPEIGSGGKEWGEHFIPEGTSAVIHFYSIHRDSRYFWPQPDSFIPERWLPASERTNKVLVDAGETFRHNAVAFVPFSYGPANCVGKHLAYQEMRAVVRALLSTFRFALEAGYGSTGGEKGGWGEGTWDEGIKDYYVMLKGKLPLVLTPRKEVARG